MKTDYEIQQDVMNQLKWNPFLESSEIGVAVKNGIVTLSGTVDLYSKKIQAEQSARKVAGVRAVAEDMIVATATGTDKSDADVAARVLDALKWNSSVDEKNIRVKVEDGIVTLEGEVEWEYQRQSAKNAVVNLAGVKTVLNTIMLKPKATPKDIQQKITAAFHRSATVDAEHVEVEVKGNKAVLKGTVRSFAERDDAEEAAWAAPGITVVENNLVVVPEEEYVF
ncbi:MAG TPA: BON domain-containing protein [Chitinophagaceae bacterium]